MYGTSKVKRVPDDQLMIELLICKAKDDFWKNKFIKSIVRPERVDKFPSAHFPKYLNNYYAVNTDKKKVSKLKTNRVRINHLRINHYWTRDEDFFIEKKIGRRNKPGSNFESFFKEIEELNECQDIDILRFAPALKENMFSLR